MIKFHTPITLNTLLCITLNIQKLKRPQEAQFNNQVFCHFLLMSICEGQNDVRGRGDNRGSWLDKTSERHLDKLNSNQSFLEGKEEHLCSDYIYTVIIYILSLPLLNTLLRRVKRVFLR